MEIRPARPSDRDDVLALLGAQLAEHAIELSATRLAAAVDGILAEPARGALFVAHADGAAVGVAYLSFTWTLEHGGAVGWLEELYVVPARRGGGIGTALLDAVCTRARTAGCGAVDLEVDAGHARAADLYRRHGFGELPRTRFSLRLRET
jgi:GNAT superfamily N-acetyltransferase